MRFNKLFLISSISLFISCNRIEYKDLEIFEGIHLGTSRNNYTKQLDSLGIKSNIFYTKPFLGAEEAKSNRVKEATSELLDFSDYENKGADIRHCSLLMGEQTPEYNAISGLYVFLGHTEEAIGISKYTKELWFSQSVAISYLDNVKNMLMRKYGKPIEENKELDYHKFFVLSGNGFKKYDINDNEKPKITKWKNKYFTVTLFQGFSNPNSVYNKKTKHYSFVFFGKKGNKVDLNTNEEPCISFSYIYYNLTKEAVEKLNLGNSNI